MEPFSYLKSRLVDESSPLFFSDGAIGFVLSLLLPPFLAWFGVVVWFRRQENRRFAPIRRILAEEVQGQVKDLVFAARRLISAARAGDAARAAAETHAVDSTSETLRTFLLQRRDDFPTDRVSHIGSLLEVAVAVRGISKAAEQVRGGRAVAVVVHGPLLDTITSGMPFRTLAGNEPGIAVDTDEQLDKAFADAGRALVSEAEQLTTAFTKRTWWLRVTEMGLDSRG